MPKTGYRSFDEASSSGRSSAATSPIPFSNPIVTFVATNRRSMVYTGLEILAIPLCVISAAMIKRYARATPPVGFFCHDTEIGFPLIEQTLRKATVYCVSTLGVCAIVFIYEAIIWYAELCENDDHTHVHFVVLGRSIHPYISRCSFFILRYFLALSVNAIITVCAQMFFGQFSPNFLSVCKPDWSKVECYDKNHFPRYITNGHYECRSQDASAIQNAQRGFPSVMASVTTLTFVFMTMYMRFRKPIYSTIPLIVSLTFFVNAMLTSIYSMNSYYHTEFQTYAGIVLGFIQGLFFTLYYDRTFTDLPDHVGRVLKGNAEDDSEREVANGVFEETPLVSGGILG